MAIGKGREPIYILTHSGDTVKKGTVIELGKGSNDFNNGGKMYFVTPVFDKTPSMGIGANQHNITRYINEAQYMGQNMFGKNYEVAGFAYSKSAKKWLAYFYYDNPEFVYCSHVKHLVDVQMASKTKEISVIK